MNFYFLYFFSLSLFLSLVNHSPRVDEIASLVPSLLYSSTADLKRWKSFDVSQSAERKRERVRRRETEGRSDINSVGLPVIMLSPP